MRVLKIIGKVFKTIIIIVLCIFLASNIYSIVVRATTDKVQPSIFGWSCAVVLSGSMEPNILIDDLIVVHEQKDYAVKDVITFQPEGSMSVTTHRIVEQTSEGFITRGDNNNTNDADPITKERIVGKVVLVIPKVGKFISFLQTPLGILSILVIGFLSIEAPDLIKGIKEKRR